MGDDQTRARNRAAVEGAVRAINAGDAAGQMAHYTDDLVLEFPFSDPPKRLEGKDVVQPKLAEALVVTKLTSLVSAPSTPLSVPKLPMVATMPPS